MQHAHSHTQHSHGRKSTLSPANNISCTTASSPPHLRAGAGSHRSTLRSRTTTSNPHQTRHSARSTARLHRRQGVHAERLLRARTSREGVVVLSERDADADAGLEDALEVAPGPGEDGGKARVPLSNASSNQYLLAPA